MKEKVNEEGRKRKARKEEKSKGFERKANEAKKIRICFKRNLVQLL